MNEELKEIMNKFDNILKHYEMDIKFGQLSIESICHLFPNEVISIKDYINDLQNENEDIKKLNKANYLSFIDCNKKRLKAIEYIKNHQPVFELSSKKQISKWFNEEYYINLLKILGGDE